MKRLLLGSILATIAAFAANAQGVVPSILNRELAPMAAGTVKGNATTGSAAPVDLTRAQMWAMQMGGSARNVLADGADPTGVADSSSAFQTALTAVGPAGGAVFIPCGKYLVAGATLSIATTKSVTIQGGGADCAIIKSATGATPLAVTLADSSSSFHFRDFAVTTGAVNTGIGISVTQTTSSANPADSEQNEFSNVTVKGDDCNACTDYFVTGIALTGGVSEVNFNGVYMPGNNTLSGTGVSVAGDVGNTRYGVVFNFVGSTFNFLNTGIAYNSYTQGVTCNACSFTGGNYGIATPVSGSGEFYQLAVGNTQCSVKVACLALQTSVGLVSVVGSTFGMLANNAVGISGIMTDAVISGNTFINTAYTGTTGVVTASGTTGAQVTGNVFHSLDYGVNFQVGTANASLQSNTYVGVSNASSPAATAGSITIGGGSP